MLLAPHNALLEDKDNLIPDVLILNPVDNEYLPTRDRNSIKEWLARLGAKRLNTSIEVLRESVLQWMKLGEFDLRISEKNHVEIINYLARCTKSFTGWETDILRENLLIMTKSNDFKLAKSCYLPGAISVKELADTISDDEIVSSSYDTDLLKEFFIHVGVRHKVEPIDVLQKSILEWIKNGKIKQKLTVNNYNPIIEFLASEYPLVEDKLTESEIKGLRYMPVLTCGQVFEEAQNCYLDSAIPQIKGFECIIPKDKLILTENVSPKVLQFLTKIGVSEKIDPINVMRKSVLKWIRNGETSIRITWNNHQDILGYIAEHRISLNKSSGLTSEEKKELKIIPILTESNNFKAANSCFWSADDDDEHDDIPGIESIIPADELVSSEYCNEIKIILRQLGVRSLKFINIYEKYNMHLTCQENVKWFFTQLVNHWRSKSSKNDDLMIFLREKFKNSSFLLAKNGKTYLSTELYSSCFNFLHDIDPKSVPLLNFENLPEDLESYLGFKTSLDLNCISELLKTFDKHSKLGEEGTREFFTTLLEQLRKLNRKEIREYPLRLLSRENELRLAKNLYYFIEEGADCYLKESYLKRIPGMSHAKTLELAELCGVNILPFKEEIKREKEISDFTLKEFYLKRLPFIVIQESRELNEEPSVILKRLYDQICLIKLYKCSSIQVQYPFGNNPVKIYLHLDNLTLYVAGKWNNKKTRIHCHLKEVLSIKTDIRDIIDMEEITDIEMEEWFCEQKENPEKFYSIEKELKKLICNEI